MKSAKFAARSVWILVAGASAALVLSVAPTTAQAQGYSEANDCVEFYAWEVEDNATIDRLDHCAPATSGLFPLFNYNLIVPMLNMLNGYLGNNNVGGPVTAARERRIGDNPAAAANQLARIVNQGEGPGMAAGYTPTETTGQFIQRHLQPLRDHNVNTWFNTTWSNPEDHFGPTRYDSSIWTLTVGADMPIVNEDLLFGVFGSFTHSDVDTGFNRGGVDTTMGTVGPYIAYTLNEWLAFDVTVAGMFGKHENTVGSPPPGPSNPKARGKQDFSGFFYSMNANANYWVGNFGVQGRFGFLHSDMETDDYNLRSFGMDAQIPGTNNELTQISLASQFNYFYDKGLPFCEEVMAMPFARVTWNFDLDHDNIQLPSTVKQHPNDDDEFVLAAGVSLFNNGPLSGTFETGTTVGRKQFDGWTVSTTVNYAF